MIKKRTDWEVWTWIVTKFCRPTDHIWKRRGDKGSDAGIYGGWPHIAGGYPWSG